ncbi:MAG: hypothetical protein KDJ90_05595 [Nitratireductor sp.]|nr:hypothetical protein [Nitratireductor sp.]
MLWEMSTNFWIVSFTFACVMCFLCGWIADRIMGHAGFGVIGNWLLLLFGCYGALFVCNKLGLRFDGELQFAILIAFGGATVLLVALSAAKAITHT